MLMNVPIRRALLSVSDKSGLVEFARALAGHGVMLISTGGTAKALRDAGLKVTPVEEITGAPEMMDGRVKTLHPRIHGGLLSVRDNPEHAAAMKAHGIEPIDLLVVNLYPFEQTVAKPGCTFEDAVENIDIGGPAMVRSAAKNHAWVAVVTGPSQYQRVLEELKSHASALTGALRRDLALAAFEHTSRYDRAIADYLATQHQGAPGGPADWPASLTLSYTLAQPARYGENPHQRAAIYRDQRDDAGTVLGARQLHGKELSYNNVADAAAALSLARALGGVGALARIGACVIKHANPCGAAVASSVLDAVDMAIAGDPVAAFGGILAVSAAIDERAAARLTGKDTFLEVIIATDFTPDALEMLKAKSANVRLLAVGDSSAVSRPSTPPLTYRSIPGGLLVQESDVLPPSPASWRHAGGPAPSAVDLHAAAAIEVMVRAMNSNAIAIGGPAPEAAGAVRLFGGGLGQVDRVTACRLAVEKAGPSTQGAIAVSDAFFPFPDGPQILIDAGVRLIVHPGGSRRDQDTLDLCNARGVTCMITGIRRFKH